MERPLLHGLTSVRDPRLPDGFEAVSTVGFSNGACGTDGTYIVSRVR